MLAPHASPPDLEFGTFSDDPPWLLEPDRLTWARRVPILR
jgi:hypothetical protein